MTRNILRFAALAAVAVLATGCATAPTYDYTAFNQSRPKSILILPPVNDSTAVEAPYSVYSTLTLPLAESGFYVFPVSVVDETFRQNGLTTGGDIANVPIGKLRDIFGADAALYVNIKQYGTSYKLLTSESVVTCEARLVDLRSGNLLWSGKASASSAENSNSNGNLIAMLVTAVVEQIVASSTDASHKIAFITSSRLLAAGRPAGILFGPRSPRYADPSAPQAVKQ